MAKKIGEVLRQARLEAGLSTRDLERITGMATAAISQVENGLRRDPGFSTVLRLARAIGISLDEIVLGMEGRTVAQGSSGRKVAMALSQMEKARETSARAMAQMEEAISTLNVVKKPVGKKR